MSLRVAAPESLRPALEAARAPDVTVRWVAPPREPLQRERWKRIWLERRRGRGADAAQAETALEDGATSALLAALDREAAALLLPPGADDAWAMLEPRTGQRCADVAWAELGGEFGFFDWPGGGDLAAAAARFTSAAAACGAAPVLVRFAGGPSPRAGETTRAEATLQVRAPLRTLALYSPLFYGEGRLQAAPLLANIRAALRAPATPLLAIPGLAAAELAAAVRGAGGLWAGPFRAAAELPAARLSASAPPEETRLTLRLLERWSRTEA